MSADPYVTVADFIEGWDLPFGVDTCAPEAWGPMPPHAVAEDLPWPSYYEDVGISRSTSPRSWRRSSTAAPVAPANSLVRLGRRP